ncbi:MAG: hypothetical protein HXS44_13910 [Theionarchaea archaeon]|nr:hypothetical protein [Theionarchaea archaeon]
MIQVQLKNLDDFKRLVGGQSIVFVKKTPHGFTYYIILKQAEVNTLNVFKSKHPLSFTEDFNLEKSEDIFVGSLVEIESISLHGRVFS